MQYDIQFYFYTITKSTLNTNRKHRHKEIKIFSLGIGFTNSNDIVHVIFYYRMSHLIESIAWKYQSIDDNFSFHNFR